MSQVQRDGQYSQVPFYRCKNVEQSTGNSRWIQQRQQWLGFGSNLTGSLSRLLGGPR